jgi:hypothetical protein
MPVKGKEYRACPKRMGAVWLRNGGRYSKFWLSGSVTIETIEVRMKLNGRDKTARSSSTTLACKAQYHREHRDLEITDVYRDRAWG